MKSMNALLGGERDLKMVERDLILEEDEVLVKVLQSSICDADLRAYRGMHMPSDLPAFDYIGHEGGGEVVEIGAKVREFSVGDIAMLFGPHNSHGDYFKAKVQNLYKAPKDLPLKLAALGEPICVGMYGVYESAPKLGDVAAVVGLNFQGLLAVQAYKKSGASKVIAVDYNDSHLKIAKQTGADYAINTNDAPDVLAKVKELTNGYLCDVVYHSCGYWNPRFQDYFNLARELTRDEGTFASIPDIMSDFSATSTHRFHHHAINVRFPAFMHHSPAFREMWTPRMMRMFTEGGMDVEPLLTATFKLADYLEAMRLFDNDEDQVKVLLIP